MVDLHRVFKPLALVLVVLFAARRGAHWLLLAAFAFSLLGDVFLMLPGQFIPGLVSFLVAHLFFIALFKRGTPWLPSRRALAATLAAAGAMYAALYPSLPPVLKVAVACYAVVIATMAAQAIGRATALGGKAAWGVAAGAVFFMLSDSLLAINRFAAPLPMAQFLVLSTYYAAQLLIAHNATSVAIGDRVVQGMRRQEHAGTHDDRARPEQPEAGPPGEAGPRVVQTGGVA
jgi:uncharacterized membrane protein YhhN